MIVTKEMKEDQIGEKEESNWQTKLKYHKTVDTIHKELSRYKEEHGFETTAVRVRNYSFVLFLWNLQASCEYS